MKNLIFVFCLLFFLSCKIDYLKTESNVENTSSKVTNAEQNNQPTYGPQLPANPYELKLDTHKLSTEVYDLEIIMLLYNNAYYVSPNEKKEFTGKFTFVVDEGNSFKLKNNLIETPLSNTKPKPDWNDNGLTNWVRVNSSYKQNIEITTSEDFEVRGYIQFTIEPRCTLEKIPVTITSKNGLLKFEIDNC